jgi:transposase
MKSETQKVVATARLLRARMLARELFAQGHSLRYVMRECGISKVTATAYRKRFFPEGVECQCGKDAKHQGWCKWRYQNSTKRQEFMRRWHD